MCSRLLWRADAFARGLFGLGLFAVGWWRQRTGWTSPEQRELEADERAREMAVALHREHFGGGPRA